MKAHLACAIVILIPLAIHPAMAFTGMAIPFLTTGDAIFMQPLETADATIAEFNSVNIAATCLESLNIDFPAFACGLHPGPTIASGIADIGDVPVTGRASFNVLPFGPVNLAFPSIAQTADETYAYQRTYFFIDTAVL